MARAEQIFEEKLEEEREEAARKEIEREEVELPNLVILVVYGQKKKGTRS